MPHGLPPLDLAEAWAARLEEITYPGGNIRVARPRAPTPQDPYPLVYVWGIEGDPDEAHREDRERSIQKARTDVRIRGGQNDPLEARILAARLHDAIVHKPPTGYIETFTNVSAPSELGFDADRFPEWSFTVHTLRKRIPRPQHWGNGAAGFTTQAQIETLPGMATDDLRFRTFAATVAAGESLYVAFPTDRAGVNAPVFQAKGPSDTSFATAAFLLVSDAVTFTTSYGTEVYSLWELAGPAAGAWTVRVR